MAAQVYKTSSHEEFVMVGNDALVQCVVPSFVADLVSVSCAVGGVRGHRVPQR